MKLIPLSLSFVDHSISPRPATPSDFFVLFAVLRRATSAPTVDPPPQKALLLFLLDAAATWVVYTWLLEVWYTVCSPEASHIP